MALEADSKFQSARYTLQAVAQKLPEARAALLPQLSANGSESHARDRTEFGNPPNVVQQFRQYTWSVDLNQPVINFDAIFAYREAGSLVASAEARFTGAKQDLIIRFAQAYFDLAVAAESLEAARTQERSTDEQRAVAERGYALGTHAITDAYEARARAATAKSQRIAAENELESKRSQLEKLLGEPPTRLAVLRAAVLAPRPEPANASLWVDQARQNNPEVIAQKAASEAAVEEIKRSQSDHLPTVDLTASYGGNYAGAQTTNPYDLSTLTRGRLAGVRLSIPIYSGGGIDAKVVEAIANRDKAHADLETARRQAAADAREAYSGYEASVAQVEALQVAIDSGERSVKGNQQGYSLGIRINSDVLNAQQLLFASRRDYVRARYDALLNGLKLKAAAGVLSEADIFGLDNLFLPARDEVTR